MTPVALTDALKRHTPEVDRFMVDLYFDTVKIAIDREKDLASLYVENKPLTMLLQHFGHIIPQCFDQQNVCVVKGRRTEWVKQAKGNVVVEKQEDKPAMWWDEI